MDSRAKSRIKWSACALLAVAFALLLVFGSHVLRFLDWGRTMSEKYLARELRDAGLDLYLPFDESLPKNYCQNNNLLCHGARSVEGVHGSARLFTSEEESLVLGDVPWGNLCEGGSFAFWMNATNVERRQRVVWASSFGGQFGVVVHDGLVSVVSVTNGVENALVSSPVRPGRFTHVAVTCGDGWMSIYSDGRKVDSASIGNGVPIPRRMIVVGSVGHDPMEMTLDDLAFWHVKLTDRQVARISGASVELGYLFARRGAVVEGLATKAFNMARAFYGVVDDLANMFATPGRLNTDIPFAAMQMSGKAEKKMHRDFIKSLESGYRAVRGVREATLVFANCSLPVEITLDDSFSDRDDIRRPAFVIVGQGSVLGAGHNVFRLYPPEMHGVIHPEQEYPLPLNPLLTRLEVNGEFLGLYVIEPFEGDFSAWKMAGVSNPMAVKMLHVDDPVYVRGGCHDNAEKEFKRVSKLFRTDLRFPWSSQEVGYRAWLFAKERAERGFGPIRYGLSEDDFLGDNPAAMYIVGDLELPDGLACRSSNADVIGNDGKVKRPAGGEPASVSLFVGCGDAVRELKFRVMPESPSTPAIFLHFGNVIEKYWRTDFTCQEFPAGGGAPEWHMAIGSKCGARHRGNTSYIHGSKRSLSLAFSEPLDKAGDPSRHLLLLSGYADPTRLRNKLAFDAFMMMGDDGSHHLSPRISWAEVFVNGRYFGLWETTKRVHDVGPKGDLMFKVRARSGLWIDVSAEALDLAGGTGIADAHLYKEFLAVNEKVARSSGEDLRQVVLDNFDVGNLVDFYLMLNLSENLDGLVTNHYICRSAEDGRWYLIPWDYDKSFVPGTAAKVGKLGNRLLDAAVETVGIDAVVDRWTALRAGVLSDESLDKWFRENTAILSPYMDYEYALLQPAGFDGTFDEAVAVLREEVNARLKWMDGVFSR